MNVTKLFLEILKTVMMNVSYTEMPQLSGEQWMELYRISEKQSVAPMIYQQIYGTDAFFKANPQFQAQWKMQTLNQAGNQARRSALFLMLYEKMRQQGLSPLVVKGIVCRDLYINPDLRISGDEDLLIPRDQFGQMDKLLLGEGFLRAELEDGKEYQEVGYQNPVNGLYLEIHMYLFARESGAYGHLNELFANAFETYEIVEIQGTQILTLSAQEHFLYLVCHSLKHFLHSGFGIRQLCDILYFAKEYRERIDWCEVNTVMREYHMYDFAMNLLNIGIENLGFSWEELGLRQPEDVVLDSLELLDDMMDGGVFGKSSSNRVHSANITLNAAENESANPVSGIAASLFPGKEYIRANYSYARKHSALIPAAYLHRMFKYLRTRSEQKEEGEKSSTQIGMERVKLLEKYKIVDK